MKAKKTILYVVSGGLVCCLSAFLLMGGEEEDATSPRSPASIPDNYQSLTACEKQDVLWSNVRATSYKQLPPLKKLGAVELFKMARQGVTAKASHTEDFAPDGWIKYIHARGAVAKVKIVPHANKYSGVFQGSPCAILRLSLTFNPGKKKAVAPGLALKIMRDHAPSANVSALVTLDGQGREFNFFKNHLSSVVPPVSGVGPGLVHRIFLTASPYPEELATDDMAAMGADGQTAQSPLAPRQLFFVPNDTLQFSSEHHEFREDLLKIPANTVIYKIHAFSPDPGFDYLNYNSETAAAFFQKSEYIADVVTTSEFVASEFGDSGIFFHHQVRP